MEAFQAVEKVRVMTGLDVREFCERLNIHVSTWYKWNDGTNTPGSGALGRIKREFGVRIAKNAKGEYIVIDDAPGKPEFPVVGMVGPPDGAGTLDSEQQMILQYEAMAQKAKLPRWEDLDDRTRDEVRTAFYVAEAEAERALREAEISIVRIIQQLRRQQ